MIKYKWIALEMTIRIVAALLLFPICIAILILLSPSIIWKYICEKADDERYRKKVLKDELLSL